MILELKMKDGTKKKHICVFCAGVLGSWTDQLYIQKRSTRMGKEVVTELFVPLESVERWFIQ